MAADDGAGSRPPCTVALTGGLASGKSSAAARLRERGVPVLDADRVVHELYRAGGAGAEAVRRLFGGGMLGGDGAVDRAALADRVAGDDDARRRLEAAVHPLVRGRIRRWIGRQYVSPVVVEAALVVETGSWRDYDVLLVVWCRPEQQLDRAVARGMPEGRARDLRAAQAPLDDKRALADVVIDNSGPPDVLASEIDRAWSRVLDRCASRAGVSRATRSDSRP